MYVVIFKIKGERVMETKNNKFGICPSCKTHSIIGKGLYYCPNCLHWFEDIDFLSKEEQEKADKECLECVELVKTEFKKNNLPLYYCNSMKTDRKMEKIRDFRKCKFIKRKEVIE